MRVYIICAVRNAMASKVASIRQYAEKMRGMGHFVHFPPDDAPQDDKTGEAICAVHREAMSDCDEVHVFWDVDSAGSHFDLGMAYALRKTIIPVSCERHDGEGKSYWKAVIAPPTPTSSPSPQQTPRNNS